MEQAQIIINYCPYSFVSDWLTFPYLANCNSKRFISKKIYIPGYFKTFFSNYTYLVDYCWWRFTTHQFSSTNMVLFEWNPHKLTIWLDRQFSCKRPKIQAPDISENIEYILKKNWYWSSLMFKLLGSTGLLLSFSRLS